MSFDPEKITFFAKTDARGQQIPFGIKAKDRQRHMYVVGKTGMGKSTLLENMAAQDIKNGEGMAFIDPHGSAAQTLLEYVPEHRVNDVIYFAPFDMDNPISFNVMEDVGADKRHLVVSGLMSTFKKIWVDAWSARMEYILTNALLALIEYPDTTLLSVNRLFSDKAYRKQVVEYIKDPAVKAFWTEEFANYTDRFMAEALPAIQNKIGQFTGNPLIRNIIGQPHSSFDIRQIMDEKKILIMNLSKGLVGETNANLLGSMLTTRIYLAAMSRADLPVEKMRTMPNFYFYVDEFQSFANSTFANILSEARKYHLNLIIAHQYIEQMEEDVRNAVFGNVGTTIAFRVGPFDAEVLETVFTPRFVAADLVNLGFAQIYLTLMIDGIGSQPFSAITLPPIEQPSVSCRDMVIAASRRNYTRKRAEVEKIVADLHTPVKTETPMKKTNNHNGTNNYSSNSDKKFERKPKRDDGNGGRGENYNVSDFERRKDDRREGGVFDRRESQPRLREGEKRTFENRIERKTDDDYQPKPRELKTTKSLSDLRSILGKISETDKSGVVDNKVNNDRAWTKDENGEATKTIRVQVEKESVKRQDLRGALDLLLKKDEKKEIDNFPKEKTDLVDRKKSNQLREGKGKRDRNRVYAEPDQTDKYKNDFHRLMQEAESAFSELEKKHAVSNSIYGGEQDNFAERSLEVVRSDQAPIDGKIFKPKMVEDKERERENDPLSPDKIQKKLKQSPKENTPFAS
ncbi:MAG: type IV secretion system DNA-binding domain-containing protein [Candidatus Nomurabacteria bacterium]|nr:type IV secretion system DNA-binding domain-containing protein [Candidatus Nomurabacteria bacterium]USN88140.1 MAG: type IV secretion system DNA-binding domain-containing protein [Candidatus Nomurabacteria bacterium]